MKTVRLLTPAVALLLNFALPPVLVRAAGWDDSELSPSQLRERYGAPGDEISQEAGDELMLAMVNAARQAAASPPVAWSAQAQEMAQEQADSMVAGRFGAHLDLHGRSPQLRWAELGGTDAVAENVVYYELGTEVALTPELLWSMLEDWVRSTSHFATLTRPEHTHMGFAVSISRESGRCYIAGVQEFLTDYGDYDLLPDRATAGSELELTGTLLHEQVELDGVGLGWMELPREQTAAELNAHGGQFPDSSTGSGYLDSADVDYDRESGELRVRLQLPEILRGRNAWVTVWVRWAGHVSGPPFCVMSQLVLVD